MANNMRREYEMSIEWLTGTTEEVSCDDELG